MTSALDHWTAAGRCWLSVGEEDEALRCFEAAGAWASLGALYERKGRWAEAAASHERSGQWIEAARCHRLAGRWGDAERCLGRGEVPLRRAWALVHDHGRAAEAEAVVDRAPTRDAGETSGSILVLARCEIARGANVEAAKKVRDALPLLGQVIPSSKLQCVVEWAVTNSEILRRPDLGALALAMAPRWYQADALWDRWSARVFGAVVPPPFPLHAGDEPKGGG